MDNIKVGNISNSNLTFSKFDLNNNSNKSLSNIKMKSGVLNSVDFLDLNKDTQDILDEKIRTSNDEFFSSFDDNTSRYYGCDQSNFEKEYYLKINDGISLVKESDRKDFIDFFTSEEEMTKEDANYLFDIFLSDNTAIKTDSLDDVIEYFEQKYDTDKVMEILDENFDSSNIDEYERLKNKLINKLGMEEKEAIMLLEQIDNTGCCTYVAMTNAILCSFKNNPDDFEKAFGYPMYIELDGQKKLNSQELLLDMYIWINSNKNNISSDLFSYDENGKLNIQSFFNDDIYTDDQIYIQDGLYDNTDIADIMSDFLNSKSIEISDDDFSNYKDFKSNDEIKNYIKDGLRNNEQMIIGFSNVDSSKKVVMTGVNSNRVANVYQWGKDEGHEAYITSYDDEGVIVSSYGDKYKITYDDLKNAEFNINKININYTGGEN